MRRFLRNMMKNNVNTVSSNVMGCGNKVRMSTVIQSNGDVNINGVKYNVNKGSKVEVNNDEVYIDGVLQNKIQGNSRHIEVRIYGNADNIICNGNVVVEGDCAGDVDGGGSISVGGDINGDVDCSGSVTVSGNVNGDVDASGSVTIKGSVGGDVDACGSVKLGRK